MRITSSRGNKRSDVFYDEAIALLRLCQKLYEKREMNMKNRNGSVGQASRLSELTWRRHLPHYQLSSGYYFITFSTHDRFILHPPQKDCVFNAVCFLDGKKYKLYAAVVLNDHVHMVINPFESLPKIMHSIKSFTAHEINRILNRQGKVWQNESYDRVIRNEDEFLEKLNYIANNPIKANLARQYEDYKWLYIQGWITHDS